MHEWLQLAFGALIVLAVFFTIHRHGRGNPESTGRLGKRVAELEKATERQAEKIDGIDEALERLSETTATRRDIETLRAEIAGDRAVSERTWHAVDRLQNFLIESALNRRKDG